MHEVFKVVVMVFLKLKYLLKISLVIRGVGTGGGGGHRGHVSDQKVVIRWKMKLSGVFCWKMKLSGVMQRQLKLLLEVSGIDGRWGGLNSVEKIKFCFWIDECC
jgi:hypothetical protein